MEFFRKKTSENLENQLENVEVLLQGKAGNESERKEMLGMSLDKIKLNFPEKYKQYLSALKTESAILHFPDMNIKEGETSKISLLSANARGYGFKGESADKLRVVKPLETLVEKDIAHKAGVLEIGPKQFRSHEGYLHEEFIDGTPILKLDKEKCTPEYMESLGQKFTVALKTLHENGILVNDQILTDDFGKSHMIIDKNDNVRFIDFGASVDMNNFPDISDEEVFSLMRTDPFMSFRISGILENSEEEKKKEIEGYREHILSHLKSKKDLIEMKDEQLLNEGLNFLRHHLPNTDAFIKGVRKVY